MKKYYCTQLYSLATAFLFLLFTRSSDCGRQLVHSERSTSTTDECEQALVINAPLRHTTTPSFLEQGSQRLPWQRLSLLVSNPTPRLPRTPPLFEHKDRKTKLELRAAAVRYSCWGCVALRGMVSRTSPSRTHSLNLCSLCTS